MGKEEKVKVSQGAAFGAGAIPNILASTILGTFLTIYLTDIAGLPAALIGTVILLLRITDGISDFIMGYVIDHTKSRWGKARPWLLVGALGVAVLLVLLFQVPQNMSMGAKIVYFVIAYFSLMTVFVTISGVSMATMLPLVESNRKKRNILGAAEMAGTMIGGILATTVTSVLLKQFGYTQEGYRNTMLVYAAVILLTGGYSFWKLKERTENKDSCEEEDKPQAKMSVKDAFVGLSKNKYFFFATGAGLLVNLRNGIISGIGIYFCRDVLGDIDVFTFMTLVMLLPVILALPIAVSLCNKYGKYKTLCVGSCFTVVGSVVVLVSVYFPRPSAALLLVGMGICGVAGSAFSACFQSLLAEVCDYGEWKTGMKMEGIIFSSTSIGNKAGAGLGAAILGWLLAFAAYDGQLVAQSAHTIAVEKAAMAFSPLVCNLLILLCLSLCNLDKIMPEIQKTLRKEKNDRS
ncbi:MFS transporter [Mediterraneibacter massiliensis]|uniref:MFS transporter n=1 Tax=Mediterraneibacter massiliensis TaxID=1720300 RepID=UPI00073F4D57|nr:glycoside-pentoside-hexuronide (GPH):cation symporter [Mediterraneibacter massiliensis]